MELNSTQEKDVGVSETKDPGQAAPCNPAATAQGADAPVTTPPAVVNKKTTIQLFTSTTTRLTHRKHGNDTYDDVINRDLDTLGCPGAEQILKEREGK